jgi:hypothetical protein
MASTLLQRRDFCVLFCHRGFGDATRMATLNQKIQCERDAREMLRQGGLPEPDRVEYGHTCIRLFWEDTKVMLVVDIDEPPEGFETVGEYLDELDLDDEDDDLEDLDFEDAAEEIRRLDDDEMEEAA